MKPFNIGKKIYNIDNIFNNWKNSIYANKEIRFFNYNNIKLLKREY